MVDRFHKTLSLSQSAKQIKLEKAIKIYNIIRSELVMKISSLLSILALSSSVCLAQGQSTVKTVSSPQYYQVVNLSESSDNRAGTPNTLDGNYVIQLQIDQKGADTVEFKILTAKSNFDLMLNDSSVNFKGTIQPQKNGKFLLEYSLTLAQLDPTKKPANKTQNNNQMLNSGLVSFILRSTLNYAPSQQIKEEPPQPQISLHASALLDLNQPVSLLLTPKETIRIELSKN